jgi:hypothetical protein
MIKWGGGITGAGGLWGGGGGGGGGVLWPPSYIVIMAPTFAFHLEQTFITIYDSSVETGTALPRAIFMS